MSTFPLRRLRRIRSHPALRDLVRETRLSPKDFIAPVFAVEDPDSAGEVASMPGVVRHALDTLADEIETVRASGIPAVLLFGIPRHKDDRGSQAFAPEGIIPQAIRRCKEVDSGLAVIADVCLCEYTDHGHCGIMRRERIDNDATLELIARAAVAYAQAGADVVAPSGMMDGMVSAIRHALDEAGREETAILSYAVKYASAFYGPFRDAAECAPRFGDRRSHQMDPANAREALAEVRLDVEEGADAVMVKPALAYLDVIHRVRRAFPSIPLTAYQVSGEYSQIKAAGRHGWIDEPRVMLETLTAIKRAGADNIITYFAQDAARLLRQDGD